MPSVSTTTLGIRDQEIVGEASYQKNIRKIRRLNPLMVELQPERRNKHDKNAVRVVVRKGWRYLVVGYLSRSAAQRWQPRIIAANKAGQTVELPARLFGGTKQKPNYGIWIGEDHA